MICDSDEYIYRLRLFDSGGDGWQGASFSIYSSTSQLTTLEGSIVATGTLNSGFETMLWECLADGCYELVVSSGSADSEISFAFYDEVRARNSFHYVVVFL